MLLILRLLSRTTIGTRIYPQNSGRSFAGQSATMTAYKTCRIVSSRERLHETCNFGSRSSRRFGRHCTGIAWRRRYSVTVVLRPERRQGYPENLSLERPSGSITAPTKATAALTEPVDVLWIATKTYQLQTALEAVQSLPTCAVTLLNGVDHVEMLRAKNQGWASRPCEWWMGPHEIHF